MIPVDNVQTQVEQAVIQGILEGAYLPGQQAPSERTMMEQQQCSRVSVRRAYAALQERGVLETRHGKGAFVSQRARGHQRSIDTVAVMLDLNDYFAVAFLDALEQAAATHDVFLIVKQTRQDAVLEAEAGVQLAHQGFQNLIVWGSGKDLQRSMFERLRILGSNIILFDRMFPDGWADYIGTDNRHCADALVQHIAASGHQQIELLAYADLAWDSLQQREDELQRAAAAASLPLRTHYVPWAAAPSSLQTAHGFQTADLEAPATGIIKEHRAYWCADHTAVIGINDYLAMQVKSQCEEASVYGIDGLLSALDMGIITYRHPTAALADICIQHLLDQRDQAERWHARHTTAAGELVVPEGSAL